MNEWISVKDKFPKFMEECIVYTDDKNINVSRFYGFGEECQGYKEFPDGVWEINECGIDVTHWMKMIEPPKED